MSFRGDSRPAADTAADREPDQDAILAELENEDLPKTYTSQRIEQLNAELASTNQATTGKLDFQHDFTSVVRELASDQDVLDFTTANHRVILHFYHSGFARCATMDKHIERIAVAHKSQDVSAARVDVTRVPFLVNKLKIRILPDVRAYVDGVEVERVIGFEGLDGVSSTDFDTRSLERRLMKAKLFMELKIPRDEGAQSEEEELGSDEEKNMGLKRGGVRNGPRWI